MSLDVLFINPDGLPTIYGNLYSQIMTIEPPLWAQMLSQGVKVKGYETKIIDCIMRQLGLEELCQEINRLSPKLIVMCIYGQNPIASTHTMHGAGLTTNFIKEKYPQTKILFVGGHVSALPEQTLINEKADYVCKGEGLQTILELLKTDLTSKQQLEKVPGLWFKESNEICKGPISPSTPEHLLDISYPGLDHDEINYHDYRAPNWFCLDDLSKRDNYASLYTSLGCPFQCSFCCINSPFEKKTFRRWSTDLMLKQLETFAKRKVRNIKIADEMFVLYDDHYLKLCQGLAERDYGFNIWAFSRVDTIKETNLKTMKKAGISWLVLGIESISKEIRSGVNKGNYSKERIKETIKMIHDAGIHVHANFLFGLPDDDLESLQTNLDFSMEIDVETANYYCAMALPGSALYFEALKNNWKLPETWSGYSQHGPETFPLPTKHLKAEEVLAFRDQAWLLYHYNPQYLKNIENKFGKNAVSYIESLRETKLTRKYASQQILAKAPFHQL